jgi:L-idonate 5-dehydrogenase
MKAVVIHASHDLRVETQPAAATPAAQQVRVTVMRGGICGSDLHYCHDGGFGAVRLQEPMTLGHEVSGVVAEVGAGVTGVAVGDKVALSPSMPCGTCAYCAQGQRGMPPLKWFIFSDRIIPFSGGRRDGWQAREARGYRAEAATR